MEVNCGGPYGGKQLRAVEASARATWDRVTQNLTGAKVNDETSK